MTTAAIVSAAGQVVLVRAATPTPAFLLAFGRRTGPTLTGKPLPAPVVEIDHIRIDCPDGEDWGTREERKVTDWLGNISYINKGYMAGGTWVSGWVG